MAERPDTLKQEPHEPAHAGQGSRREEAIKALRRLREIGERQPPVDAVAIVREGRDQAGQGSR